MSSSTRMLSFSTRPITRPCAEQTKPANAPACRGPMSSQPHQGHCWTESPHRPHISEFSPHIGLCPRRDTLRNPRLAREIVRIPGKRLRAIGTSQAITRQSVITVILRTLCLLYTQDAVDSSRSSPIRPSATPYDKISYVIRGTVSANARQPAVRVTRRAGSAPSAKVELDGNRRTP
jgi:hypothetical protein